MLTSFLIAREKTTIVVGEIAVLLLIIGFCYQLFRLKNLKKSEKPYRTLIKVTDPTIQIDDFPEIKAMTNWTFQSSQKAWIGQTSLHPNEMRHLVKEHYPTKADAITIQLIPYTWWTISK
ncbi:hypothetical protein BOVMAS10_15270 [Streptococcus uberis]